MLRGLRWQVLALVFSLMMFVWAFMSRPAPPDVADTQATEEQPVSVDADITPQVDVSQTPVVTLPADASTPLAVPTLAPATRSLMTFREGVIGEVTRLNPLLRGVNPVEDDITALIYEGLVRTNAYGEPEPALAVDWVIANNQIEYVFRLREDIFWQDGVPFNAEDVAFTMELLRDPDFPGDPSIGEFWRTVETEVLAPHIIRFRLSQPLASFLDALRIGILPKHALEGIDASDLLAHPFNLSPIGTGAYQLEALRAQDGRISMVDLRRSPIYAQRPEGQDGYAVERVRFVIFTDFEQAFASFSAGDIDGLAAPSAQERLPLLNLDGVAIHTKLEPILGALIFNWRRPPEAAEGEPPAFNPFREQRVRQALIMGINREGIIERNMVNLAVFADNPLLPGSWAYNASITMPAYDPTQASTLLETANLGAEEGQPLLSFAILTPNQPLLNNIAQEIVNQWSLLNIDVEIEQVSDEEYRERLQSGAFDVAFVELSFGKSADPDVYSFWHQGQYPDGNNYSAVDDRRISETLERARRDPFGINRVQHYTEFQQEFSERVIAIPLYYPLYTYAVRPEVDGVQFGFIGDRTDRFRNLQEWRINR